MYKSLIKFFRDVNPKTNTFATVYYVYRQQINKYIPNTLHQNPLYYENVLLHHQILFRFKYSYKRAVEVYNQKIKNDVNENIKPYLSIHDENKLLQDPNISLKKLLPYLYLEVDNDDNVFFPVIPENLLIPDFYNYTIDDKIITKKEIKKLQKKGMLPKMKGDNVNFRRLYIPNIYVLKAGGGKWENPNFKYKDVGYQGPGNP